LEFFYISLKSITLWRTDVAFFGFWSIII
jgi:hypothetical protein